MSRLGELLVREQLISPEQLQRALEDSRKSGDRLGNSLVKMGVLQEEDLTQFLSKQYGVPAINLAEFDIDQEVIDLIPKDVAAKHRVIPVNRSGASLIVAMTDPSNIFAIDDLKFLTGYNIEVVVVSEQQVLDAIGKYYTRSAWADPLSAFNIDDVLSDFEEDVDVAEREAVDKLEAADADDEGGADADS